MDIIGISETKGALVIKIRCRMSVSICVCGAEHFGYTYVLYML